MLGLGRLTVKVTAKMQVAVGSAMKINSWDGSLMIEWE
jgi:hypothetical protein